MYCSDRCRARCHRSTQSVGTTKSNGAAEDLKQLCRRGEEAKGLAAVKVICERCGLGGFGSSRRKLDDLTPEQEQQLRAELEELLNSGGAS